MDNDVTNLREKLDSMDYPALLKRVVEIERRLDASNHQQNHGPKKVSRQLPKSVSVLKHILNHLPVTSTGHAKLILLLPILLAQKVLRKAQGVNVFPMF